MPEFQWEDNVLAYSGATLWRQSCVGTCTVEIRWKFSAEMILNAAVGALVQNIFRCGAPERARRKPALHGRGVWTVDYQRPIRRHEHFSERPCAEIDGKRIERESLNSIV
jgi:hypothetical protein